MSTPFKMKGISPLKQHEAEAVSTYVKPPVVPVVLETSNGKNGGGSVTAKAKKLKKNGKEKETFSIRNDKKRTQKKTS